MKFSPVLLAALCLLPLSAGAAPAETTSFISTTAWRSAYSSAAPETVSSRTTSSLFYTDAAGRLTLFEMESESGVMTVTIRQDGAIAWRRSFPVTENTFAVSRRENNGEIYFLITAGDKRLRAGQDSSGAWDVRPAGEDPRQARPL